MQNLVSKFRAVAFRRFVDCRAVLVDGPSFPLLCVARTDLGMPMDAIFGNHPG